MTMFVILNAVSSLIFGVLTSAIRLGCIPRVFTASLIPYRFIFVRSSMQEKIQNVLKRKSFRAQMIFIGSAATLAFYAFYFYEQIGNKSCKVSSCPGGEVELRPSLTKKNMREARVKTKT